MATSTLPSRGPQKWAELCITPAFSGVPDKGDKIRSGYITPPLEKQMHDEAGEKKGKIHIQLHTTPCHLVARFYQPLELNPGLSICRCIAPPTKVVAITGTWCLEMGY